MPPLAELRRRISKRRLLELAVIFPLAACVTPPTPGAPKSPTQTIKIDDELILEPTSAPPTPAIARATSTSIPTAVPLKIIESTVVRNAIDTPEVAATQIPPKATLQATPTEKAVVKDPPKSTPSPVVEIKVSPPSIIWQRRTEIPFMSSKFVLLSDKKYVYGSLGNRQLSAFDITNGQSVWTWQLNSSVAFAYRHDEFDPSLLFATHGDNLWVLDKNTGQPKFPFIPYMDRFRTSMESINPSYYDGVIAFHHLFRAGNATTVVDKYTGNKLWYTDGIVRHAYANSAVVNTSRTGKVKDLNIVDAKTGEGKYKVFENEDGDSVDSYYEEGFAYISVSDSSNNYKIVAIDLEGRRIAWSIGEDKIKGYKKFANKDPKDDNLYVQSRPEAQSGEVLTAVSKKSGKVIWSIDLGKRVKVSPTVLGIVEGVVVLKDAENFTTVLVDSKTGNRSEIGKTQLNSIVGVHNQKVLVGLGGYDPHTYGVYGIDLFDRKEIWRRASQQHNSLSSIITGGVVFFAKLASEKLQAYDANDGKLLKDFPTGEISRMASPLPGLVLGSSGTIYAIKT